MPPVLKDDTFRQIAEFIYARSGIFIPETKKYLVENRLLKLIEDYNLRGYDELLYMVKYSPNGRELDRLFDAITTNETYFFREPQQFDVLMDVLVPKLTAGKGSIKVWSAACSSGEEPYTVSILMKEKTKGIRTEIIGTDLSHRALESAQNGLYTSYSVRNVPPPYMSKYFRQRGQDYALDPFIKSTVRFKSANLMDDRRGLEFSNFDVVFCRNVLIYFDDRAKKKVSSLLYDSLKPGGYLIIGSSESLHNITRAFKPVTHNRVIVYEKV